MSTVFLPAPPTDAIRTPPGGATLVIVVSPVRGPLGELRTIRQAIPAQGALADALPTAYGWQRLIVNGAVVSPEDQARRCLCPGDELLAIPTWGTGIEEGVLVGALITAAIGIGVSVVATVLSYLLFPPAKPHLQAGLDDPSFSFEGIRTAIGPGQVVPVIYGRMRTGGQLLSASVDQAMTVVDGGPGNRVRVDAVATPPTLSLLLGLCEGPIGEVTEGSIEINGQPIANFPGVITETRLGLPDQTPLNSFNETRNTFADGREIPVLPGITYTTTVPVQAFGLNIVFEQGLYVLTSQGEKQENIAVVGFQYRVHGSGTFTDYSYYDVAAARTSTVRFGIRKEGLALAVYDITVTFSHATNVDDLHAKWTPTLESVTEIQSNTQAYANTALLGLRSVATNALQGALPNVTVIVLGMTIREGGFAAPRTWEDNPAFCVLDFLTSTRYGLGIPDSDIDLPAFVVWGAYCDEIIQGETRHTLNYTLDRDLRAQVALLEMMGGSRAILLKSEGLWTPRVTQNTLPVQLFSWANCANVQLTYTRDPDRINVLEARFANEESGFLQDVLTWPPIDSWPAEVNKSSLELRGVTKPSRVMRALQFELNRKRFEILSLEMDCALDAMALQIHDVFRFSHPLPGWGVSGRMLPGSTTSTIVLDQDVTFLAGYDYHLVVRHDDDEIEVKQVSLPGPVTTNRLILASPLGLTPIPYATLYAFGILAPTEGAVKLFRVVKMARKSDTTVHLQAIAHNPSIYDEAVATALPVSTSLFNPLGPPPPLTSLILTEVTRVQASGASLRVVNLSWDVAALSTGYGPYGGAEILRRTVASSAVAGTVALGATDLGAIQDPTDANVNFVPLAQVRGHVLDFDDYTAISGATYVYRVVPLSQRGVPNQLGAREGVIHVTGPTTPGYFPGSPRNLRLQGQPFGATTFEGQDIHIQWDPVADSPLFSATFFVQDYIVEVWAPGQLYHLRTAIVPAAGPGQSLLFTYTLQQNAEDQIRNGQAGARRDIAFWVWARTNTNRQSLDPAVLTVNNPPPDMGDMIPETIGLFQAALINFDQFAEPRDFDHYLVYLDTVTPPGQIYQDVAVRFAGVGNAIRKLFVADLLADVTYYTYILPFDTFGAGIPSQIASFTPVSLTADTLDSVPPATPTGLTLTTGTTVSADGTIMAWVQADWAANTESDLARYEIHFFVGGSTTPTVFTLAAPQHRVRLESVPGGVTITAHLLALDNFANASAFTADATITTASDTVPPAAPTGLIAVGSLKAIALLWTPPADADYATSQVWASLTNDRATASQVGTGDTSFTHEPLGATQTWYYWLRAVDTSKNFSTAYYPASATAGIAGTTGQIDTTYISSLAANKLISGTIAVLVRLGVNNINFDGVNSIITVLDTQSTPIVRIKLGKLGTLSTDWGLQIFNAAGQLMWNLTDGAHTPGVSDSAITAAKIAAATIVATHLRTDTAVITTAAQILNALISTAHIADAAITNAKVVSLQASKITADTIQALLTVGVGNHVFIDGPSSNVSIYDSTPIPRVLLGQVGGGASDYGLRIWDQSGNLMWDLTGGAQTAGINNAAVITQKISTNAVSEALGYSNGGSVTTSTSPQEIGRVTIPRLEGGDQVLLVGKCDGAIVSPNSMQLSLCENGVGGAAFDSTVLAGQTMQSHLAVQTVYTPGTAIDNKVFILEIFATSGSVVDNIQLAYIRRQR